jgi:hypothetical protein
MSFWIIQDVSLIPVFQHIVLKTKVLAAMTDVQYLGSMTSTEKAKKVTIKPKRRRLQDVA